MRPHFAIRLLTVWFAVLAVAPLFAQSEDPAVGVAVKIWGKGTANANGAEVSVWGSFLPSSPTATDGDATITVSGNNAATVLAVLGAPG